MAVKPEASRHNLPTYLTQFVARKPELRELQRLLGQSRLVTLTGVGGIGKTRLAVEVAAHVCRKFSDGVRFIDLGPTSDGVLVPAVIASALSLDGDPEAPIVASLVESCREKHTLVVLDNCEHLLDACARVTDELLRGCSGVRILATSRENLGLAGEVIWQVPPLSLPDINRLGDPEQALESSAVELFVRRVAEARPGYRLGPRDALAVAQICHRLDGIPLALELAAARSRTLSLEQIAARLEDPLRLLGNNHRYSVPRHHTLRAAIDWSYQLLSDGERTLLRRLALFVGSWTLEGAEQIVDGDGIEAPQVLDLVTGLVEKSLVLAEDHGHEFRYRLLETVRDYARERLMESGEFETLNRRYMVCLTELADRCDDEACFPLTPREREIALLVAQGLTNRGVAQQLVISPGTVRIHLEHIFRKMDVHSRSQLAAIAARHIPESVRMTRA